MYCDLLKKGWFSNKWCALELATIRYPFLWHSKIDSIVIVILFILYYYKYHLGNQISKLRIRKYMLNQEHINERTVKEFFLTIISNSYWSFGSISSRYLWFNQAGLVLAMVSDCTVIFLVMVVLNGIGVPATLLSFATCSSWNFVQKSS